MPITNDEPPAVETDESTTGSVTSSEEGASDVKTMKKIMTETKVEGGKSVWATTLETFGMSDGKKKKGDVLCNTFEEAFAKFQELIRDKNWKFATTPFDDFQASKDDLLKAFVHWSRKGEDDEFTYNISKAVRRLEAYVEWMDKNCQQLDLKGSSMKEVADAWKMKMSHDKHGRLVWWIDLDGLDFKHIKQNVPREDTLRYFVWLSHLTLFDAGSQEHGFVLVEGVGHKGMIEMMTCVSMDVGTKLDRLTIGILPIKMEACILFNNPTWVHILMALMSPFLSKKMRKRIKSLKNKQDTQAFFEEELGKECIPTGITRLAGVVEKDIVEDTLGRL